ncbi:LacI family DNA-binding transcriptional regulator [Paenibacillus spongiae]|uniref:LacI family transcriptional regulator n=1 Tax=Paenibacillus spongiae TaxID=2909671 RepID=A0ABY5SJV3_9BACL|nr:LacI family DNA-binding transcriptional regulator [Paenibacillus spongiae]UVI32790.1 LacI family transcriptional regulator [Paenibacillus spongiae]
MVTSLDVAKMANVSVSSVSRTFQGKGYISNDTKLKVLEAAHKLGYTPNLLARSLRNNRSKTIGLIISNIDNTFYSDIAKYIEMELRKLDYRLIVTYSDRSLEQERNCLELLSSSRVDGIILIPVKPQKSKSNLKYIDALIRQNIIILQAFHRQYEALDSVIIDDYNGSYLATNYLINNGHVNIISVQGEGNVIKLDGYTQAFTDNGLQVGKNNILTIPSHADAIDIISRTFVENRPTAVIANDNRITLDVLKVCKSLNLKIPDQISIIAHDDSAWLNQMGLSSIQKPKETIGRAICNNLLNRINAVTASTDPITLKMETSLIMRRSIKNLHFPKPDIS